MLIKYLYQKRETIIKKLKIFYKQNGFNCIVGEWNS